MERVNWKQRTRWRFGILFSLMLICVYLRYAFQINIPQTLILLIAVVVAGLGSRDEIIAMGILCIPFSSVFSHYITIMAFILIYLIKFRKDVRIGAELLPLLLLIAWELMHCFSDLFSAKHFLASFIPILLCFFLMMIDLRELDYAFVVRVFAIGCFVVGLYLITQVLVHAGFNVIKAFSDMQRLGMEGEKLGVEVSGGEMNPNTLGVLCVLAMSGLLQLISIGEGKQSDYLLLTLLLVIGVLTTSKTFLVCLVILVVLFIMAQKGSLKKKLLVLARSFAVLAVAAIMIWLLFPDAMKSFGERFQERDISSGRAELMAVYHDYVFSSPRNALWGIGVNNFIYKVITKYAIAINTPHNGFQEVLVAWGIPGLIFFLMFLFTLVRKSRRITQSQRLINYIPLILLLIKVQAGQMITSGYTMLAFSFAYLSLIQDFSGNTQRQVESALS